MEIRELDGEMEYTTEERDALIAHGISVDELRTFLRSSDAQNLDTAIGGILMEREQTAKEAAAVAEPEIIASKLPEDGGATS